MHIYILCVDRYLHAVRTKHILCINICGLCFELELPNTCTDLMLRSFLHKWLLSTHSNILDSRFLSGISEGWLALFYTTLSSIYPTDQMLRSFLPTSGAEPSTAGEDWGGEVLRDHSLVLLLSYLIFSASLRLCLIEYFRVTGEVLRDHSLVLLL